MARLEMESFTAIVLAGGASTRMGRPKALLRFGSETLIERITARLATVAAETIVVSGPHVDLPPLSRVRVVEDETPLQGPVAGILYGLAAAANDLSFVCGCDHPFLEPAVARLIADRARGVEGAVATTANGVPEPLVAAYRKCVAAVAADMLARGERRAALLVERSGAIRVPEEDLRRADPSGRTFIDVDTPEAYRRALDLFHEHPSS